MRRPLVLLVGLVALLMLGGVGAVNAHPPRETQRQAGETPAPTSAPSDPDDADPEDEEEVPPSTSEPSQDDVPPDPLQVVIEEIAPAVIPEQGEDLTVTGRIRNRSTQVWTDLRVYLLTSPEPLTSADELAVAAESDPRIEVGNRLVDPGLWAEASDLEPGESTPFTLVVPRADLILSGAPGVYWLGVQVLGTTEGVRLEGADGRARTFLPLVPSETDPISLALAIQVRNQVVREPDGTLSSPEDWSERLAPGGRLRRVLALGRSARQRPLTWVVDAAVIDAARSLSDGNPPLVLADGQDEDEPPAEESDPSASPDAAEESGDDSAEAENPGGDPPGPAQAWLSGLTSALQQSPTLSVPYGDLDLSAAVRAGDEGLVATATELSKARLEGVATGARPVAAPPEGRLSPEAADLVLGRVPAVLAPDGVEISGAAEGTDPSVLNPPDAEEVLLAPAPEAMWGPSPLPIRSALSVRQRLLADAALHALSDPGGQPLIRFLPPRWDPGERWRKAAFFPGLRQPWLVATELADLLDGARPGATSGTEVEMVYTEQDAAAELRPSVVAAADALVAQGRVLAEVLLDSGDVDERITGQALLSASVWNRDRPGRAAGRARETREMIRDSLNQISVRAPEFVTMSSEEGTFQVTVINGLDQPVLVGLDARIVGDNLTLTLPEPIELAPRSRGALRIDAAAADIGVHAVTLQPISTEGTAIGTATRLSVRSSRVGLFLWVVMAAGAIALFGTITVRVLRRVRRRRRTHGPLLRAGSRSGDHPA